MKSKRFTMIEMIAIIFIMGTLAAMILPALGNARPYSKHAKCKSNLKQIGTTVATYFSDGVSASFPITRNTLVQAGGLMEIDENISKCPIDVAQDQYIWLTDGEYNGSAESELAGDSAPHKKHQPMYKVFQDGHVQ